MKLLNKNTTIMSLPGLILGCSLLATTLIHASLVASENFNSLTGTPRDLEDADSPLFIDINEGGLRTLGSNGDPFGLGASDTNLALGNANLHIRGSFAVENLTTVSFDFFEPTGGGDSLIRIGFGGADLNATNGTFGWEFNNGTVSAYAKTVQDSGSLPTLSLDKHYIVSMMVNETGSSATIDGTGLSVGAGQGALFIYDVAAQTMIDGGRFHSLNSTTDNFIFREFSGTTQSIVVDNIQVFDTLVAVPEPQSVSLGLIASCILLVRRRRA